VDISNELHVKQFLRLAFLRPCFLYVLRAAYLLLRSGTGFSVRLEDEMLFEDGLGLHGGDAGEDVEDLVMACGGDLAEEEELVHCVLWERSLGLFDELYDSVDLFEVKLVENIMDQAARY